MTRIRHQTRIARARSTSAHADALVEAIEAHLCDAEAVIRQRPWYRRAAVLDWWHGTSIEQAFRSLHAARAFLVDLIPDSALDPLIPGAIARVGSCLQPADPRRLEVERLADPHMCPRRKRAELVHALQMGYAVSDESHAHVRDFRNLLLCATGLILLFMVLFVVAVADHRRRAVLSSPRSPPRRPPEPRPDRARRPPAPGARSARAVNRRWAVRPRKPRLPTCGSSPGSACSVAHSPPRSASARSPVG